MLGRDIVREAPADVDVTGHTRGDTDVTDAAQVTEAVRDVEPDVIVNAAAYTAVDRAEEERNLARAVNEEAPGLIGRVATSTRSARTAHRSLVVHFSTDYVFDGTADHPYREDDPVAPLGTYGRTKLAGERTLVGSGAPYIIMRTSWLFGSGGRSFPRTIWERATSAKPTQVVNDQRGRPTYSVDLARVVWRLVVGPQAGSVAAGRILHAANSGVATWYDVAARVFDAAGRGDLLVPCTTVDYPTPAKRPAWSVLDTGQLDALLGPLPPWEDAVDRFLGELTREAA
jgi:dTDP-4-dehydrorhamnose reductase